MGLISGMHFRCCIFVRTLHACALNVESSYECPNTQDLWGCYLTLLLGD